MKRLLEKLSLGLLLSALIVTVSCGDDEETTPDVASPSLSVTFLVDGVSATSAAPGDTISFALAATAEGLVNTITGKVSNGTSASDILNINRNDAELDINDEMTSASYAAYIIPGATEVGSTWDFTFVLVDDLNEVDTAEFSVTISELSISQFETVLIGGQSNATLGSFYDAVTDSVYSASDAFDAASQENIDFVFWYGGESLYAIGATSDATAEIAFGAVSIDLTNLTTRNDTQFKSLDGVSATDFDDVFSASGITALTGEVDFASTNVTDLNADDVFGILLDSDRGSKYGLVKVVSTGGTAGADRVITLDVKIEK